MLSLEVITPHRLLEVLRALRLSRTIQTGWELGLLRDKACTTVHHQCKSLVKTPLTQPSSILVALNYPYLLMFSRTSELSGRKLFQTSIALVIRLSVTPKRIAIQLLKRLSQSVSR